MTRPRRTTPAPTQPLPERIRQALAADWTSLTTLDTLTGARGSDARRAVHDALGALRGEGAVLEERVTAAGVEVRLRALLAAPVEVAGAAAPAPHGEPDAAPVAVEPSAPAEGAQGAAAPEREPTDPHFVECPVCRADPGHPCKGPGSPHAARAADAEAWARVQEGLAPVPVELILIDRTPDANGDDAHYIEHGTEAMKAALPPREPGPSSRCAVCARPYARHADAAGVPYAGPGGHPFTPKPRGRPRVAPVAAVASEAAAQPSTAAEPETSRGGSEDRDDASTTDDARQRERERLSGPSPRVDGQPAVPGEATDQAPPMARTPRAKRTAAPVHRVDVSGCRPPLCHADDIHEPSRLRAFARPLCEAHRRWVEGAGGTLAAGGLAGVVAQAREPST